VDADLAAGFEQLRTHGDELRSWCESFRRSLFEARCLPCTRFKARLNVVSAPLEFLSALSERPCHVCELCHLLEDTMEVHRRSHQGSMQVSHFLPLTMFALFLAGLSRSPFASAQISPAPTSPGQLVFLNSSTSPCLRALGTSQYTRFARLVEQAQLVPGVLDALFNFGDQLTVFAPTDDALRTSLTDSGVAFLGKPSSLQDLQASPLLTSLRFKYSSSLVLSFIFPEVLFSPCKSAASCLFKRWKTSRGLVLANVFKLEKKTSSVLNDSRQSVEDGR
jgi:hypothetical protein